MLSDKIKDYLNEYISQEVYVQVAVAKGKNKISTNAAISKYFESNHFQGLAEGKPYNTFLDDLKDKCLGKLTNSPMKDSKTEALPSIWENKDEFNLLMTKASNNMFELTSVIDEAEDVKTALGKYMWSSCKSCHSKFRAEH